MLTDKVDGVLTDMRLTRILEAKENDYSNMVFPFVAAMVDRCCGRTNSTMNKCFVRYAELCQIIRRYGKEPESSDLDLIGLGYQVRHFECQAN